MVPNHLYLIGGKQGVIVWLCRGEEVGWESIAHGLFDGGRNSVVSTLPCYEFASIFIYDNVLVFEGELQTSGAQSETPFVRATTAHAQCSLGHPFAQLRYGTQQCQMLTLDQLRSLDTEEKSAVIIGYLGGLRYAIGHAITVCRRIEMAELRYVLPIILEKEHLVLSVGEGARYSLPFLSIDLLSLRDEITIITTQEKELVPNVSFAKKLTKEEIINVTLYRTKMENLKKNWIFNS